MYDTASAFSSAARSPPSVVFGHRHPVRDPSKSPRPGPGGDCSIPSFAKDNIRSQKGFPFGERLKTEREIAIACGYVCARPCIPPAFVTSEAPGFPPPLPLEARTKYQVSLKTTPTSVVECSLGTEYVTVVHTRLAGGASHGRTFCSSSPSWTGRLPWETWVQRLEAAFLSHLLQMTTSKLVAAPNLGTGFLTSMKCCVPSGTRLACAVLSLFSAPSHDMSRYPEPPAPGGNCKVPSFVDDNKRENKGVVRRHERC